MTPARRHLVWDWNGTLLDDVALVVACSNAVLASVGGPSVTLGELRVGFRMPLADYYAEVLGEALDAEALRRLAKVFFATYQDGLGACGLTGDAGAAVAAWPGTQSLLSLWRHDDLVAVVHRYGLTEHFTRIDGVRTDPGGDRKAESLRRHLAELGVPGSEAVLIGDSLDDADAAESVGAAIVLYTGGFTEPARLRATPHPVADTLTEAVRLASAC